MLNPKEELRVVDKKSGRKGKATRFEYQDKRLIRVHVVFDDVRDDEKSQKTYQDPDELEEDQE